MVGFVVLGDHYGSCTSKAGASYECNNDSTEKRSFVSGWWGDIGEEASFLAVPSLCLAALRAKVGHCPG